MKNEYIAPKELVNNWLSNMDWSRDYLKEVDIVELWGYANPPEAKVTFNDDGCIGRRITHGGLVTRTFTYAHTAEKPDGTLWLIIPTWYEDPLSNPFISVWRKLGSEIIVEPISCDDESYIENVEGPHNNIWISPPKAYIPNN